jgi:hypothetical protein
MRAIDSSAISLLLHSPGLLSLHDRHWLGQSANSTDRHARYDTSFGPTIHACSKILQTNKFSCTMQQPENASTSLRGALSCTLSSRILCCSTPFRASQKRAGGYVVRLPDNLNNRMICKTPGSVNTFLSGRIAPSPAGRGQGVRGEAALDSLPTRAYPRAQKPCAEGGWPWLPCA